uniref:NALCN channel auxiliary factor 1 n=1 Tax=Hucho hucho TaxID=62062 RepID=A0A4W5QKT2_9TELE
MTRGAWMCRQQDDGLKIWFAPRENEKPFTESERAQRWRLSLASLLFITVLLSDHLWFCAEAKLTRTRDKWQDKQLAFTDMAEYLNSTHHHHIPSSDSRSPHSRLTRELDVIFIGNSTKPLWRLDICHPDSLSKDCFTFTDSADVNLSDLYLSFCNSYSLLDLFSGFTSPDNINCSLDVAEGDTLGCSKCVRAYQRFDRQAQEDYREFELLVEKYETDEYSVRTCMEECKVGYASPHLSSLYCMRACSVYVCASTSVDEHLWIILMQELICNGCCVWNREERERKKKEKER